MDEKLVISHRHMRLAQSVSKRLSLSLARRKLQPAFSDFYVTTLSGMTPLIAVLDTSKIGDHTPYTRPDLLHQLSTDLGGMPVYLSNHSGIRYVVLLSPLPKLAHKIELPADVPRGKLAIGMQFTGKPVLVEWETMRHMAVLGASGSGKTTMLQSIVTQAIRDEMMLMLSDLDGAGFAALDGHPLLAAPVANTAQDALGLVEMAISEFDRRAELYKAMPEHPQKLSDYNAVAFRRSMPTLPRILVILDEASSVLTALGGAKGAMGQALATLGWRGRKFGVHFVFAAQEFTKDILGPVREQAGITLCFRTGSAQGLMAARMGCKGAERIPEGRQGLAISNRHGPIQTYFVDGSMLGNPTTLLPTISDYERALFTAARAQYDGKLSRDVLTALGVGQREGRRLQDDWRLRGWAWNDPNRGNSLYITNKLADLLTSRPARPAQTSPDQPDQPPDQPDQPTYYNQRGDIS
ncbi:MAG TPA: hypothetical protein DCG54_09615 [Anaerolineae bacterium]|jgi:energy-coupling factor transporter ATP-binding protein EcfA2|nr:hypothetical protein [Anaerolineae bacterium]